MMVNEVLISVRSRSFYMGGDLVSDILVLFFNFSNSGWVSLTVGEGVLRFLRVNTEPELSPLSGIDDEFAYPIRYLNGLENYIGLKVFAIYEYRLIDVDEGCIGVYFDFRTCGFSVVESNDCLSILHGKLEYHDNRVLLVEAKI
ncbi:hypothetical protein Q6A49_02865 [Pseudomonas sp. 22-AL-CL-001]|uniref:hypothetical protein n=1 Tax=Pseudomonas alabamensis TaxID=3064349 RepID=UPI0027123258|nr:hypothetical protein [Pseudomonas sp. 22-AL-CL-001]MDO7909471.1 hypothetical protein [Pseudomonas sp. 22-AL-CL-001]